MSGTAEGEEAFINRQSCCCGLEALSYLLYLCSPKGLIITFGYALDDVKNILKQVISLPTPKHELEREINLLWQLITYLVVSHFH